MKKDFFTDDNYFENSTKREQLFRSLVRYTKNALFGVLVFVELLILANVEYGYRFWVVLSMLVLLAVNAALKIWVIKNQKFKLACYIADTVFLVVLMAFSSSGYLPTLYMVLLTEFYLYSEKLLDDFIMFGVSVLTYSVAYGVSLPVVLSETPTFGLIFSQSFNTFVALGIHFLIVNFAIVMYRHNIEMRKKNLELDEANKKLKSASEELRTAELLKERQRIAKDIHDTAGHSITICIMQTEAAKMLMESNLEEAKKNIVSANIQAKHALDELRESVHLLSGQNATETLKESLLNIIADSTTGTNIKIRYDIEEISLSKEKRRIVENTLKEGISNGLRHGKATAFYFELSKVDGEVHFLLSDNGEGGNLNEMKDGLGLGGLKKRLEEQKGKLTILSEPQEGFELHMSIPFEEDEQ